MPKEFYSRKKKNCFWNRTTGKYQHFCPKHKRLIPSGFENGRDAKRFTKTVRVQLENKCDCKRTCKHNNVTSRKSIYRRYTFLLHYSFQLRILAVEYIGQAGDAIGQRAFVQKARA